MQENYSEKYGTNMMYFNNIEGFSKYLSVFKRRQSFYKKPIVKKDELRC